MRRHGKKEVEEAEKRLDATPFASDTVAFGERVDAPPKVSLKRKHWSGTGGEGPGENRMGKLMERMLRDAKGGGSGEGEGGKKGGKVGRLGPGETEAIR